MAGRALTREQNERARVWVRELLDRCQGNQSELGRLLGVAQGTVSRVISGQSGTSFHIISRMAKQLGRDPREVLDPASLIKKPDVKVPFPDSRFPSSHRAQQAALVLDATVDDIRKVIDDHDAPDDPGDVYWIGEFLRARDRRRRREGQDGPPSPNPVSGIAAVGPPSPPPKTRRMGSKG